MRKCRIFISTIAYLFFMMVSPNAFASNGPRQFQLVNQCDYPVWFGFAGGSATNPAGTGTTCQSDSDCYDGTACIQTGDIKQCFWKNPKPSNGTYKLDAKGGSNSVTLPGSSNAPFVWSGAVGGRRECDDKGTCAIGDCGTDGSLGCKPGTGLSQPTVQAEFTLSKTGLDFYDVEIINGVSIPTSMGPVLTSSLQDKIAKNGSPYFCGTPGAATASSSLLADCSWEFTPPSIDYRWVRAGGKSCSSDSDCSSGGLCGLSFNPGQSSLLQKTCGEQLGYWSADQVCGINPSYGSPFNCGQSAGTGQGRAITMTNLYACTSVDSCYQSFATAECCGCVNWDQQGLKVPSSTYTEQCVKTNQTWLNNVYPRLEWMKKGCPTAYTYPYDDMSSTFTCTNLEDNVNQIDYVITFCPKTSSGSTTTPSTGSDSSNSGSSGSSTTASGYIEATQAAGKCVDLTDGGKTNGTKIQIWDCVKGNTNQQWTINSSGQVRIGSKCLDVTDGVNKNGTKVQLWDCVDNNTSQRWAYTGGKLIWNGNNKCLDLTDGSQTNGNKLQIWDCTSGNTNQNWTVTSSPTTSSSSNNSSSTTTFAYTIYVPQAVSNVTGNGTACAAGGACQASQQAGQTLVVKDNSNTCNFTVGTDGKLSVGSGSSTICSAVYTKAATTSAAGVIALPANF